MRRLALALLVVAGCGGAQPAAAPTPTLPTSTPTPVVGPWAAPVAGKRTPIACPASSSRAGWASRVRSLGGGRYVKANDSHAQLTFVNRDGEVLRKRSL